VPGALSFDQNEHVTSQGVFLQNELSLSQRVHLTLGVRFDQVEFEITDHYFADGRDDSGSKQFDDTSPMAGLVVEISPSLNFYTTYSTAFETPTTTEFNRQDGFGGFNETLEPQSATNFEVGLRGTLGESQRYEVAVFTIDVEDELIGREIPTSPGRNYFENAGQTSREGVELNWLAKPTDRIETTISYTYSDFKFTNFVETVTVPNPTPPPATIPASVDRSGNVLPGTTENLLFGEFQYHAPGGWFAAADVLYVDEQFGDNANTVVIDDYTLTNLRVGYETDFDHFTVSVFGGVNNATDENYTANVRLNAAAARYFEPGPTRNGYAGVTFDWKFR
jgi:iron complex outermembrane receptor protein